jgi:hypothetical protein
MKSMTDALTITTTISTNLYTEEMQAALKRVCAPIDKARPGDVLAVVQTFLDEPYIKGEPIVRVLALVERDGHMAVRPVRYQDLPDDVRPAIATAIMDIQSNPGDQRGLASLVRDMSARDGEIFFANLIMMPSVACFEAENFYDEILNGCLKKEGIEQYHIDAGFQMILAAPASSHALLAAQPDYENAFKIIATYFPMVDADNEPIDLSMPTLKDILK